MNKKFVQNAVQVLLLVAWTVGAFLLVSYSLGLVLGFFSPDWLLDWLRTPAGTTSLGAIVYILSLLLTIVPLRFKQLPDGGILKELGVRRPQGKWMVGTVMVVWIFYLFFSFVVMMMLYQLNLSGIDLDQRQDVGFTGNITSWLDYVLAFITLVVLAPIFEEAIFRGFLFGQLRKYSSFLISSLVTSLAFAVVHFQFNVGVDVFILSLFMCYLREKFQSLWPSILLHAIKNGLAYTFLFILPLLGVNLLQ